MFGFISVCEDSAVDVGVQGFDSTIQHFWALSNFFYRCYIDVGFSQSCGCASTRNDVPAKFT